MRCPLAPIALSLAPFLASTTAVFAADPPRYVIVDLGTIGLGSPYPYSITNANRVVLNERDFSGAGRPYVWENGVITTLDLLPGTPRCLARAMSANGLVGGSCGPFSDLIATVWDQDGPRRGGGLAGSFADIMDVSDNGNITGYAAAYADQGNWHGFAIIDGVTHDIGAVPMYDGSDATAINDAGRVAGARQNYKGQTVPYIWDAEHGIREMATLGGTDAYIRDMNNAGQVVGYAGNGLVEPAATSLSRQVPALWEADGSIKALATLPNRPAGEAFGINAAGDAVGSLKSYGPYVEEAALWRGGVLFLLKDVIPPGSGWTLKTATDINDAGWIVGAGSMGGRDRAFLLIPE